MVKCSIGKHLNTIGLKMWRDDITNEIKNMSVGLHIRTFLAEIHFKLAYYEAENQKLKEATSTLELALWNAKIDELE